MLRSRSKNNNNNGILRCRSASELSSDSQTSFRSSKSGRGGGRGGWRGNGNSASQTATNGRGGGKGGRGRRRSPYSENKYRDDSNEKMSLFIAREQNESDEGDDEENENNYPETDSREYTFDEIFEMAKSKKFPPKRIFYFGNKKKAYSPITHFFTTTNKFSNRPANIKLKCNVHGCNYDVNIKLDPKADFSNANKHLFVHQSTKEWYSVYNRNSNQSQELVINQNNLVCFFITSKTVLNQMKNPFFTKICDPKIKI